MTTNVAQLPPDILFSAVAQAPPSEPELCIPSPNLADRDEVTHIKCSHHPGQHVCDILHGHITASIHPLHSAIARGVQLPTSINQASAQA